MNIAELLVRQSKDRPGQPALIERRGRRRRVMTYGGLDDQSARGAALMRAIGLGPGSRVLVFVPLSIDLYVALTALFRVGAAAVVIDPWAGPEHVEQCCAIAAPDALIAIPKAHLLRIKSRAVRAIPRHVVVGHWVPGATRWARLARHAPHEAIADASDDTPALLTFTSGSTGRPKCAVRTHGLLLAQHAALARSIELSPGDVDFATLPIFALANLASGLTTLLGDESAWDEPAVTRVTASPAFFEQPHVRSPDERITRLYTGGAPIFPSTLERLAKQFPRANVTAVYGSTEAEPIAHAAWDEMTPADWERTRRGGGLLAGRPVEEVRLRIIANRSGTAVGPLSEDAFDALRLATGAIGEIVVAGDHVLKGYLDGVGDAETKIRVGEGVWHRTGDAGHLDDAGRLWLAGRASAVLRDEQGEVYPLQAEAVAVETGLVRRCALVRMNGTRALLAEPTRPGEVIERPLFDALAPLGVHTVRIVPEIPVDRRHRAKIDYAALGRLVRSIEEG